ncbi:hypothetical protein QOZ88_09220 [Blastococcus sp. BMG 814]|uniref:Secreted protein n=1 Tax=Blastococcus carthaginiensis TaxID=3050034 RepID=A0ABT9IB70_9ACTN|nr:hypothetical protein [Blastococcus carthaginiensis]MDP5182820.1 hypothetical protein [Blastococcus carthaginiensis]
MSSSVKIVRWAALVALAAAVVVGVAFAARSVGGSDASGAQPAGTPAAGAPATPEDASGGEQEPADTGGPAGADGSADAAGETSQAPASTSAPRPVGDPVEVLVRQTYSGWDADSSAIVVGAVVAGVIESGGTCTLTVAQGLTEHTASSKGSADASTTTCGRMSVPGGDLDAGEWTAMVSYESPAANGESQWFSVVVP